MFNLRTNRFTIIMTSHKRILNQFLMAHILANLECFQVFEGSCSCSIVCIKIKVRGSKVCVNCTRIIHAHSFRTPVLLYFPMIDCYYKSDRRFWVIVPVPLWKFQSMIYPLACLFYICTDIFIIERFYIYTDIFIIERFITIRYE